MLIAHISDFHVFSRAPETALVRLDSVDAARKVAADLAAFAPALDAVIFTGDLTDGGSAEDYALLADVMKPLRAPLFVVPGNHDKRPTLRATFADQISFADDRFLHYETTIGPIRLLALDTLVEGCTEGRLCRTRLDWLHPRLKRDLDAPLIIAMHHPPFPSGVPSLDAMALVEGGDELGRLLAARRAPTRILSGHIHRPYHGLWRGAFVAVAGSPAFQVGLDLAPGPHEPPRVDEPYAYFVHHIGADDAFAIHTRYVSIR